MGGFLPDVKDGAANGESVRRAGGIAGYRRAGGAGCNAAAACSEHSETSCAIGEARPSYGASVCAELIA
jgi:hypothetical protein